MGMFRMFKKKSRENSLPENQLPSSGNTGTGVQYIGGYTDVVTPYGATSISSAFRAIAVLSDSVGKLPLRYRIMLSDGRYVDYTSTREAYALYEMLTSSPNSRMTAFEFFKNMVKTMLLHGNAYILPVIGGRGEISELVLCSPGTVMYDKYLGTYDVYDVLNGISGRYGRDEMIHVRNESLDGGYTGISTIEYARHQLGIASASNDEAQKRVTNGGRFKALVSNDHSVQGWGNYQDKEMESGVVDRLQTQINAGKDILYLPGDVKLTQMSMTSADMQFLDQMKFSVKEIARMFNVPPALLMDDTNANYKSGEMSSVLLLSYGLSPLLRKIEQEFTMKLVPEGQRGKIKFEFDLSGIYSTDLSTRGTWTKCKLETGLSTVNELRRESGMPAVEGGDEPLVSANLIPLNSAKMRGEKTNPNN